MREPLVTTGRRSKVLDRLAQRWPDRVKEYGQTGDSISGWYLVFEDGLVYDNDGQHSDLGSVADLALAVRNTRPCECAECQQRRAGSVTVEIVADEYASGANREERVMTLNQFRRVCKMMGWEFPADNRTAAGQPVWVVTTPMPELPDPAAEPSHA
jgi:hypothetical protein